MMTLNKPMFMNYFENGTLLQHDKDKETFLISKTEIEGNFCLDQEQMEKLNKFIEMADSNAKVSIKLKGTILEAKIDKPKLKANINTLSIENKPTINLNEPKNIFTANVEKLKIAYAFSAKKSARAILNGVCIKNGYILATDSFSAYKTDCNATDINIVIANSFISILKDLKGDIELKTDGLKIWHTTKDNQTYIGRLIVGNYPDLDKIYNSLQENTEYRVDFSTTYDIFALSSQNSYIGLFSNSFCINTSTTSENAEFEGFLGFKLYGEDCALENEYWFSTTMLKQVLNFVGDKRNVNIALSTQSNMKPAIVNDEFLILPVKKL